MRVLVTFLLNIITCFGIENIECHVVIIGGNTGALSAGITAANAAMEMNMNITVCLVEPSNWLGGQMTTEGVTGIDYGDYNRYLINQPQSFRDIMSVVNESANCWVSTQCYQPKVLLKKINETVNDLKDYLKVFYRSVLIQSNVKDNKIINVIINQRVNR